MSRRTARSAMLWICLLLPALPLDVFARAGRPPTPRGRSR